MLSLLPACVRNYSNVYNSPVCFNKLNNLAIFTYLKLENTYESLLTGKGRIKLDPILRWRDNIAENGKVYLDCTLSTAQLIHPINSGIDRLVVPDSLSNIYEFTTGSEDFANSYSIFHQFSPLLPTKSANIFFVEHVVWGNSCSGNSCIRILLRHFIVFKVENNKIEYLKDLTEKESPDFIVFGGFSKKDMDSSLPGEKITKFGW